MTRVHFNPPNVQTKTTPLHVIQYMQLSEAL